MGAHPLACRQTEVVRWVFGLVSSSVPDGCEPAKPGLPNDLNCFAEVLSVFEIPPVKSVLMFISPSDINAKKCSICWENLKTNDNPFDWG